MVSLNNLTPAPGSTKKPTRVGRGIGSGKGKTCGRGHKGQKSRSGVGGLAKGFEGGQMPLQRRLPKFGFSSRIQGFSASVRVGELNNIGAKVITLEELKKNGIVNKHIRQVKVFASGEVTKALRVEGLKISKGAKELITQKGGSFVEPDQKPNKKIRGKNAKRLAQESSTASPAPKSGKDSSTENKDVKAKSGTQKATKAKTENTAKDKKEVDPADSKKAKEVAQTDTNKKEVDPADSKKAKEVAQTDTNKKEVDPADSKKAKESAQTDTNKKESEKKDAAETTDNS